MCPTFHVSTDEQCRKSQVIFITENSRLVQILRLWSRYYSGNRVFTGYTRHVSLSVLPTIDFTNVCLRVGPSGPQPGPHIPATSLHIVCLQSGLNHRSALPTLYLEGQSAAGAAHCLLESESVSEWRTLRTPCKPSLFFKSCATYSRETPTI